jgi:hypothetical protein
MSPHRSASPVRSGGLRPLAILGAIAIVGAIPGCAFLRDQLGASPSSTPPAPPPAELSHGPSPVFDDESRAGAQPLAPSRKDQDPATRRDPPAAPPAPPPAAPLAARKPPPPAPAHPAGEASVVPASAGPTESAPQPSIRTAPREAGVRDQDDTLEEIFQALRQKYNASTAAGNDQYAAIERADLEAKLIATFFIRDRKKIEDFRDLIRSFRDDSMVNVELELLKAALYQKVGQADLRDRAIERVREATAPASGTLRLQGLAFARDIRGYRAFTPLRAAEFAPGEEVLIYGEIEGFRSTPLSSGAGSKHRRSFAAELILRDEAGTEIDRRELLRAGQAVEVVEDPAKPVHFWGRYPFPASLSPGSYRIEIDVQDLEGQKRTKGRLSLKIK